MDNISEKLTEADQGLGMDDSTVKQSGTDQRSGTDNLITVFRPILESAYTEYLLGGGYDPVRFDEETLELAIDRCKAYGGHAVGGKRFALERLFEEALSISKSNAKEIILVIAPEGSGKSTFLSFCLKFLAPYEIPYEADNATIDWVTIEKKVRENGELSLRDWWKKMVIFHVDASLARSTENIVEFVVERWNRLHSSLFQGMDEDPKDSAASRFVRRCRFLSQQVDATGYRRHFPMLVIDNTDMLTLTQLVDLARFLQDTGLAGKQPSKQMATEIPSDADSGVWRIVMAMRQESYANIKRDLQSYEANTITFEWNKVTTDSLISKRNALASRMIINRDLHYQADVYHSKEDPRALMELLIPSDAARAFGKCLECCQIVDSEDGEGESGSDAGVDASGIRMDKHSKRLFSLIVNNSARRHFKLWGRALCGKILRDRMREVNRVSNSGDTFRVNIYYFVCSLLCLEYDTYSTDSDILNLYKIPSILSPHHAEDYLIGHYALLALWNSGCDYKRMVETLARDGFSQGHIAKVVDGFRSGRLFHFVKDETPLVEEGIVEAHYLVCKNRAYVDTMAVSMREELGLNVGEEAEASAVKAAEFIPRTEIAIQFLEWVAGKEAEFVKGRKQRKFSEFIVIEYSKSIDWVEKNSTRVSNEVKEPRNMDRWLRAKRRLERLVASIDGIDLDEHFGEGNPGKR